MVKRTLPLGGYVRVSRVGGRDEDRLRSPDFQRESLEHYAKREGFVLELFPPEIDVSGAKPRRAVLDGIIGKIQAGELGGIVVAALDRLSRLGPKDRVLLFESIEDAGGVVLSASEPLDPSTPEGRFQRELWLGIARMRWEQYRDGWEKAKAGSIKAGVPVNSRPAVGYRRRDDRRLSPDPTSAPIVARVFEQRALGAGPTELAELLEANGVTTSQGSTTWSKQAVYGLLSNRVYLGELSYGRDQRYVKADAHEPIVDLATWMAAQHPNGRRPAMTGRTALLVGLVRCGGCRYSLQHTTSSHGTRIYRCTRRHAGGECQAPVRVRADVLEAAVLSLFWSWAQDVESVPADVDTSVLEPLEAALERSRRRLAQIDTPEAQDAYSDGWLDAVRERRIAVEQDAQTLGQAQAALAEAQQDAVVLPSGESLEASWDSLDTEAQRRWIAAVLHTNCVALHREPRQAVVYQRGTEPEDLPRRGFKAGPTLEPFPEPTPPDAMVIPL